METIKWNSIINKAIKNMPTKEYLLNSGVASFINAINIMQGNRKNSDEVTEEILAEMKVIIENYDIRNAKNLLLAYREIGKDIVPKKYNLDKMSIDMDSEGGWCIIFV